MKPILVVTFGNDRAGADGLGPLVAQELARDAPPGTDVVNLGRRTGSLLELLPGRTALVVVDAVLCPGEPEGRLVDGDWSTLGAVRPPRPHAYSSHELPVDDQLELAHVLGLLPPTVRLVGITISRAHVRPNGNGIRGHVLEAAAAVRRVVQRIRG